MFLEKDSHNKSQGWIEVICGSMFSGKTEELIRRLKRAKIAKLKVEIFKPGVDTRYSDEDVVSHNATALHSIPVESAQEILFYATDVDVIGIDEAQFLDDELPNVCQQLANQGVRVIIAGLDMVTEQRYCQSLIARRAVSAECRDHYGLIDAERTRRRRQQHSQTAESEHAYDAGHIKSEFSNHVQRNP